MILFFFFFTLKVIDNTMIKKDALNDITFPVSSRSFSFCESMHKSINLLGVPDGLVDFV